LLFNGIFEIVIVPTYCTALKFPVCPETSNITGLMFDVIVGCVEYIFGFFVESELLIMVLLKYTFAIIVLIFTLIGFIKGTTDATVVIWPDICIASGTVNENVLVSELLPSFIKIVANLASTSGEQIIFES